MARVKIEPNGDETLADAAFKQYAPALGRAAMNFAAAVYAESTLSLREVEGARYRTALISGCVICKDMRGARDIPAFLDKYGGQTSRPVSTRGEAPGEEFYSALNEWRSYSGFSEREKVAIELAERMGERPQSMQQDEAFWVRARGAFSDAELVELTLSIGSWIGLGRVVHTLELDNVCAI